MFAERYSSVSACSNWFMSSTYNGHAPHVLLAGLVGSPPRQMGGRPDLARDAFEHAIDLTHRQNLMYLVLEARIVAVALQDNPAAFCLQRGARFVEPQPPQT